MTGIEELTAMRKAGKAPASGVLLHLIDQPLPPADPMQPVYLRADVNERFDRLDLRALVGLRVTVHGPYLAGDRVQAAAMAVMKAGASSVLGFASDRPRLEPENMVFAAGDFSWLA